MSALFAEPAEGALRGEGAGATRRREPRPFRQEPLMKRPAMPHALTLAAAAAVATLTAAGSLGAAASTAPVAAQVAPSTAQARGHQPVSLEVLAPGHGANGRTGGSGGVVGPQA